MRNGRYFTLILSTFLSLTVVPCCGGAKQAPPPKLIEAHSLLIVAQYFPPVPPEFEVAPLRLPHLSPALRKRWPHIISAVVSRNGKNVAFFDSSGVYLTNARGRTVRKLRVLPLEKIATQETLVSFMFGPSGRRLAVMVTRIGGEPIGYTVERLWAADVASGDVHQLKKWEYRVQGSSPVPADRKIERWSTDGKAVIIVSVVYGGEEMPIDARKIGTERVVVKDTAYRGPLKPRSPRTSRG